MMEEEIDNMDNWFPRKTSSVSPTAYLLNSRWKHTLDDYSAHNVSIYFENSEFPSHFKSLYALCCGIPAASVEVERLWSRAGQIFSERRNRMFDQTLSCELFLKMNAGIIQIQRRGNENISYINPLAKLQPMSPVEVALAIEDEIFPILEEDDASDIDCSDDEELKRLVEEEDNLYDSEDESVCFSL